MFELIFDAVLAAVLLFFFIGGARIPELSSASDLVEAKGFPMMFAAIALVLLAADIIRMARELAAVKNGGPQQTVSAFDTSKIYKVAIVLAMSIIYIVIVKIAGFVLLSILYTFAALNVLKSKNHIFNIVFSVAAVLVLTLIFGRFFGIALPRGVGILKTASFYLY